jgi:AcrR family transcriptional regulator
VIAVATTRQSRNRSRNRRGEGRLLRTEILAAATELLDAGGDERAVTLRAVARRAGIAAPSIYPHFPGQAAILLAIVQQGFEGLADQIRSAVDAAGDDPRLRLDAACTAFVDFADSHPERYRTMFGGSRVGLHGLAHQHAVTTSYPWPADIVHRIAAPLSQLVVT